MLVKMIEKLPEVPFRLILKELSFEDRLCLGRVCKKLKDLLDGQVFRNLFIFLDSYPCHETLFHTDELVHYADSCRVPDFDRFISSRYKENLRQLRKMTIFFEGSCMLEDYEDKIELDPENLDLNYFFWEVSHLQIDLEHLNFFEKVEHLEIKVRQKSLLLSRNFQILPPHFHSFHLLRESAESLANFV